MWSKWTLLRTSHGWTQTKTGTSQIQKWPERNRRSSPLSSSERTLDCSRVAQKFGLRNHKERRFFAVNANKKPIFARTSSHWVKISAPCPFELNLNSGKYPKRRGVFVDQRLDGHYNPDPNFDSSRLQGGRKCKSALPDCNPLKNQHKIWYHPHPCWPSNDKSHYIAHYAHNKIVQAKEQK